MPEPKKFKKGWFKDELTVKGRTWFDYFAEDTYDPNDLIFLFVLS